VPIVYIHGVAVRDDDPTLARVTKRFGEVPWETIEGQLREHVAPVLSEDPSGVPILRIYWGDLGARFARGGRSLVSQPLEAELEPPDPPTAEPAGAADEVRARTLRERGRRGLRTTVTALRRPIESFLPTFIGDVMTYVAGRGTADAPGPIPQRILDGLEAAAFAADARDEPLVVLTHSMGGQILYDALTHFIPRMPGYDEIRVDFWCATASQVGFFEELGLFLESDPDRLAAGELTALPGRVGGWWNVWDHSDLLSFRAEGIFAGVDDSAFFAAGTLATDHFKYLAQPEFYRMFGERVRARLESQR
jgi:hypothetical protein